MTIPLTQLAHRHVGAVLKAGEIAIDATAGNGHDTCFLAEMVGETGTVYAFDIQDMAIESTRRRLVETGRKNVVLIQQSHSTMLDHIPESAQGQIGAVMFNLGYLPSADHAVTTQPESTCAALDVTVQLLRPGGILTVLAYRGHTGGIEESDSVRAWVRGRGDSLVLRDETADQQPDAPVLFVLRTVG